MSEIPQDPPEDREYDLKVKKLELLQAKIQMQKELPHLYGWKWYRWARAFFESRNKNNFLVAGNQASKSSSQIRKCIHWATAKELWPELWPHSEPLQFWYLYPTKEVATIEFKKKWVPQFLPKGAMKESHPLYGWKHENKDGFISAIHFNSGVSIIFKTYAQNVNDLQTGTVDSIFCDEELLEELYSELNMRRAATDGYFHMVFTATIGQEFWRETMEERGTSHERFPDAFKQSVSLYDCLKYEDGTSSHWTIERIQRIEKSCKNDAEVLRRVYGRFVVDGGRKYPGFEKKRSYKKPEHPGAPPGWFIYAGVDVGGGGTGHPAAIVFVAVRPDMRYGRIFKAWRGDGVTTTASDVYAQYLEMAQGLQVTAKFYDWQSKDFFTITSRLGDPFQPAEKGHDIGEQVVNVLFKNEMLHIDDIGDPELEKLVVELLNLKKETPKQKAKDDLCDAGRYSVVKIPWDWNAITGTPIEKPQAPEGPWEPVQDRTKALASSEEDDVDALMREFGLEVELDAIQELYEV